MKILASGHPGVDQYARTTAPADVEVVARWSDVRQWGRAEKILVGQHLPDFAEALAWIRHKHRSHPSASVVIWVAEPVGDLPETVEVWKGEIDADRLARWWASPVKEDTIDLESRWAVIALCPFPPVVPLAERLAGVASARFGPGGGWVDADWGRAELSLAVVPHVYQRPDYPFERLKAKRGASFRIVPQAPGWRPGSALPESGDLDRLLGNEWPWQGWYLGSQIGRRDALYVLGRVPQVILWGSSDTPPAVTAQVTDFCHLYRSDQKVLYLTSDAAGHPPRVSPRVRWPMARRKKE